MPGVRRRDRGVARGGQVEPPLKHVAQTLREGHRLRLALSNTYFPLVWPAPEAAELVLDLTRCILTLPERRGPDGELRDFDQPVGAPALEVETQTPARFDWHIARNGQGGGCVTITDDDGTHRIVGNDLTVTARGEETYSFDTPDDFAPKARVTWTHAMARGDWRVRSETETNFTSTREAFEIRARLRAWEGDMLAHEEEWHETIPRNLA